MYETTRTFGVGIQKFFEPSVEEVVVAVGDTDYAWEDACKRALQKFREDNKCYGITESDIIICYVREIGKND